MNLLRSDRLLANQLFSTVRELPGVNPCSFGQLPPSSQTAQNPRTQAKDAREYARE